MQKDGNKFEEFRSQLENHYQFPTVYLFKFIIPKDQIGRIKEIIPGGNMKIKKSRTGKYIGVSIRMNVDSSEEVIRIYKEAYAIKGIISL